MGGSVPYFVPCWEQTNLCPASNVFTDTPNSSLGKRDELFLSAEGETLHPPLGIS